jgi:hypothetical protein
MRLVELNRDGSPAGRPIERRTAQALRRRSRTSAAKPGLAKLVPGETGVVAVLSHTIGQAHLIADHARAFLQESPVLFGKIENVTAQRDHLEVRYCHSGAPRHREA